MIRDHDDIMACDGIDRHHAAMPPLFRKRDSAHIAPMAKQNASSSNDDSKSAKPKRAARSPAKSGKAPASKASKPELKPLDAHLAELLNPALNKPHVSAYDLPDGKAPGAMEEAPQAGFAAGDSTPVLASDAVSATMQSLEKLLMEGNPLFRDGKTWVPHRPERPEKSEGGYRFHHEE